MPGEKVLWCGPNSRQVVEFVNAARKAGTVSVSLNYRLTPEDALYVIDNCDASIAYVDAEHAPMFAELRDRLDKLRQVFVYGGALPASILGEDFVAAASADAPAGPDPEQSTGATMIYTSGTTGKPTGALCPDNRAARISPPWPRPRTAPLRNRRRLPRSSAGH